jgi:hypothetical protein
VDDDPGWDGGDPGAVESVGQAAGVAMAALGLLIIRFSSNFNRF